MLNDFMSFMKMVGEAKFPMDNIALKLFLEVCHWYSLDSTTKMRYSKETKQFWWAGYRMFHGQFIQFMSGGKNEGDLLMEEAEKGYYDPLNSQINFAVPSIQSLQNFRTEFPLPKELTPGLIEEAIALRSSETSTSFALITMF